MAKKKSLKSSQSQNTSVALPTYVLVLMWATLFFYSLAWFLHLYTGTVSLRGFFGDGSLAFLIHLSDSYVFNKPGHLIHLFSVGFPRDFQLLLNALSLQAALWLDVRDPAILKYIFVFWQFALPGFLYLGLFAALWRAGRLSWAVFPLISWAVLSVPIDWNAVNSTRWAIPIFWMHFYLVILAGSKFRLWPVLGTLAAGAAMLGGLYESVVVHAALCLTLGGALWWRTQNKTPFIYALAAVPGACRALLNFMDSGHNAPNSFHGFALSGFLSDPYFFFIACVIGLMAVMGSLAAARKLAPWSIVVFLGLLIPPTVNLLSDIPTDLWPQMGMRFDYIAWSLALMGWAGLLRLSL